jgi:O-acetyl-ADP-ribose deacetylase (regulator of RNase III)
MNSVLERIHVVRGDITALAIDAIVNAANSRLAGGGGVDGAIHRAAGPLLMEECRRIQEREGGCPTGGAVMTGAGQLACKAVIHAVGPVWRGGNEGEARDLASCYRKAIELAVSAGFRSIAFPNISTGVYGYPKPAAAKIAFSTVLEALSHSAMIQKVLFVCFDVENYRLYRDEFAAARDRP